MLCALYRTFLGWLDLNVVRFCFGSQRLLCAWYWTFHTCLAHHHKNTPSAWRGGILRTCALRFMFANKLRYSQLFASTFFCKRTFRARVWSSFPSIEVSLLFQNHFVIPVMTSSNNFRLDMIQRFKLPPWLWEASWDHTAWRRGLGGKATGAASTPTGSFREFLPQKNAANAAKGGRNSSNTRATSWWKVFRSP